MGFGDDRATLGGGFLRACAFFAGPVAIALAVSITLAGIPAATRVARGSGIKDPQFVVIDEVAGQLVALIAVPLAWKSFLAAFILFRAFDIVKPPPVRQLEALPRAPESCWMTLPPDFTHSELCISFYTLSSKVVRVR